MANPRPYTAQPRQSKLVRTICMVLIALIVLIGLAVLIIWLSLKPKKPRYSIENASISNLNIANNHLNGTFNFVIRAFNPNSKVSIYYDKVEVYVFYDKDKLAASAGQPFFQPHRNETNLDEKLVAQNVTLTGKVVKDLGLEKAAGNVELDVQMKAKVRFKYGSWKTGHRRLRVFCSPVFVQSSKKNSQTTDCHVSL
ncbi:unnamed protein product [Camellia sinensis]